VLDPNRCRFVRRRGQTDQGLFQGAGDAGGIARRGTARVKLGYAFDRFLVYGTGGFAYGHIVAPRSFSGPNVIGPAYSYGTSVDNAFLPGWTVGAGVGYALTRNISVNAEYLYIKLQHHYPNYATSVGPMGVCNISGMHGFRFGVNFSFSPADIGAAIGAAR
jgi:outer membrane immunogenic protein